MKDLEAAIDQIGRQMVACDHRCGGVSCDQLEGILPRCLILEIAGRSDGCGCAVVGINPGHARAAEIAYYKRKGTKYEVVVQYWRETIASFQYYVRLRKLMNAFGLNGPILWTELAKCENAPGTKFPPLKTLRDCTGRFLTQELEVIPLEWPLIGVGKEAYQSLAYRYPTKTVIGIPHPTGAYGDRFSRHLPEGRLHSESNAAVRRIISNPPGELLWIGDVGRKAEG
jgi:hypothetical protein